ncbi:MAG: cation-transporting P-type ATPase [Saprospirales bacterium]|nr:MAG: cation-transporting P-type ATPase [Saprospirales bacterium]
MNEDRVPEKINWHTLNVDEALQKLSTSKSDGLSKEEAEKRISTYGKNELPVEKQESNLVKFLKQFHNILIYVLITAAVITAFLDHWVDTFVILAVVMVNAIVGYIQEGKAEEALEQLRKMLSPMATVVRDGSRKEIPASNLCPGDIVLLKSGDRVPADLRLIEARSLRIEEAILTGESEAVEKQTDPIDGGSSLGDRTNLAFSGTMVTYGRGTAVVTGTGMNTELGKIRELISEVQKLTTPLLRQMDRFAKWLSVIIVVMAVVILLVGWLIGGQDPADLFLSVIALAVASIPEGLPAIMTITLALGVRKMAGRNAIIRKLPAVETLGSVSIICTDKTGTLTRNEMMVTRVVTPSSSFKVSGDGYGPQGEFSPEESDGKTINPAEHPDLLRMLDSAYYCNDSEVDQDENGQWVLKGEPTEGALIALCAKADLNNGKGKRLDSIPFESENKYMATLHDFGKGDRRILVKGAPEKILAFSNLNEDEKVKWKKRMEKMAAAGLRVMGFAERTADDHYHSLNKSDVESGLKLLGMAGIIDPPRPEAIQSIEDCKSAGIQIKMITGDHAITASAIGQKIGIENSEKVITGEQLSQFQTDEEWEKAAHDYSIFARTNPEHKLRLVEAYQRKGLIVAMTGDGVNDAPALKRADVGVAMGIKGTEVTKNAADMVLADDNFQSIASAVEEGRTIYNNLQKAILFILPTNGAEALLVMSSIMVGFTLPITPVQVLWVNMVTAVTLALALAFEPPEKNIMKIPPRNPEAPVIGGYFLWRIAFVSILVAGFSTILFFYFKESMGVEFARTIALNTLVAGQVFYLFNSRYLTAGSLSFEGIFGNKMVLYAAAALLILQLGLTYLPFMQNWFETHPLKLYHWGILTVSGVLVFLLVELEKFVYRTYIMRNR